MKQYFKYGKKEKEWLKARDPILGAVIDRIGHIYCDINPDLFSALIHSIAGQQISTKAHVTVWSRMQERFVPFTPKKIYSLKADEIQSCGITMRKAHYIKGIAESVINGSLDLDELKNLSDEEVCKKLVCIKGVGAWTAEMLMIFSMQRKNILSWGDLAIQRALRNLYRHREITPKLFEKYRQRYSPYASVASLYLWAVSD